MTAAYRDNPGSFARPGPPPAPPLPLKFTCRECGADAGAKAVKCPACGVYFYPPHPYVPKGR